MSTIVDIDGSFLVGGGQILRLAASFSVLQSIPIRVKNIRAGRKRPGLRAQHVEGLKVTSHMCDGKLNNAFENSEEVELFPGKIHHGLYEGDVGTAGSVCLILQVALPCSLFSSGQTILRLTGGTDTDMAPPIDYTTVVLQPILKKFGVSFDTTLHKRGFFPRGGGSVEFKIDPIKSLKPVNLTERGYLKRIWGESYYAGAADHFMKDFASVSRERLRKKVTNIPIDIKENPRPIKGTTGSGLCLFAETSTGCIFGSSAFGKGRESPSITAGVAIEELLEAINSNGCVDQHAQDQVIIFMALAAGTSRIKCGPITLHTETAIHVAELLTRAKFTITEEGPNTNIIECIGIGRINDSI